jgi:GTP-binding protein HflX
MPKRTTSTEPPSERAFLVGIELRGTDHILSVEDSLAELSLLADTAGMTVVGETYQKINKPDPNTFIGSGKVGELKDFVEETIADTVIFDEELSPRHQRQLEGILGENVKVLDRTALILDIFAQHAHTREGAVQVELAQYEYRLPRLTRQWTHLARQAGGGAGRSGGVGGVGLRGPGETQLEVDRREISRKITYLKAELEKIRAHRGRYRAQRKRTAVPTVAIVGYTNAGKSTLLNTITNAGVLAADQLFATLDPTTRRVELPGGKSVLLTDTVGFIQKLPTTLVAAFRATLEEIAEADVLLHVVDVTHPNALEQAESVMQTLEDLEVTDIPIVTALNKIDRLGGADAVSPALAEYPNVVAVSALKRQGLDELLQRIQEVLQGSLDPIDARVPYTEGQLISIFHEQGSVESVEHEEKGVRLKGRVPTRLFERFKPYLIKTRRRNAP